ncbi:MAG: hypothetical protein ABIP55_07150 [Tepidisphaeraceae bacterium]
MRLSDEAVYRPDFAPPKSLPTPFLRVEPRQLSFVVDGEKEASPAVALEKSLVISSGNGSIKWKLER